MQAGVQFFKNIAKRNFSIMRVVRKSSTSLTGEAVKLSCGDFFRK